MIQVRSSPIRVNGRKGLDEDFDPASWELRVEGPDGDLLGTHSMDDIRAMAKVEHTIEHKCVEGWSHIITWGGARFSDLASLYEDQLGQFPDYVDLRTPDGGYYVGVDLATMLHPQTLLTYEMQGQELEPAPRRTPAADDTAQIRHQADQTDWHHPFQSPATLGLLA